MIGGRSEYWSFCESSRIRFFEDGSSVKKMIGHHFCEFPLNNAIFVDVSQIRNVVGLSFSARIRLVEDIVVDAAYRFDLDLKVSRRLADIVGAESDHEFVERLRLGLIVDRDCLVSAADRWFRIKDIFASPASVLSDRDLEAGCFQSVVGWASFLDRLCPHDVFEFGSVQYRERPLVERGGVGGGHPLTGPCR